MDRGREYSSAVPEVREQRRAHLASVDNWLRKQAARAAHERTLTHELVVEKRIATIELVRLQRALKYCFFEQGVDHKHRCAPLIAEYAQRAQWTGKHAVPVEGTPTTSVSRARVTRRGAYLTHLHEASWREQFDARHGFTVLENGGVWSSHWFNSPPRNS